MTLVARGKKQLVSLKAVSQDLLSLLFLSKKLFYPLKVETFVIMPMATPFLDLEIFLFVFSSYVFLTFDKWIPNKYHSITLRTLRTMNKCNNIKIKNNVSEKLL